MRRDRRESLEPLQAIWHVLALRIVQSFAWPGLLGENEPP